MNAMNHVEGYKLFKNAVKGKKCLVPECKNTPIDDFCQQHNDEISNEMEKWEQWKSCDHNNARLARDGSGRLLCDDCLTVIEYTGPETYYEAQ